MVLLKEVSGGFLVLGKTKQGERFIDYSAAAMRYLASNSTSILVMLN